MSSIHRKRSAIRAQLCRADEDHRVLGRAHAIAAQLPHSDRRTRMLEDLDAVIDAMEVDLDYLKSALSVVEGVIAQGGKPVPHDPVALPKVLSDT